MPPLLTAEVAPVDSLPQRRMVVPLIVAAAPEAGDRGLWTFLKKKKIPEL